MQRTIEIQKIAQRVNFTVENTHKLLDIFYESTDKILNNLETHIQQNDYDKIYRNAHSLKGSSSNLLFDDVYIIAKEIESSAKDELDYPYLNKLQEIRTIIKTTKII